MSKFAYTAAQTQAVTELSANVNVIAGAGSGKTKVLVKRFLYLLGDNYKDHDALDPAYIQPLCEHIPHNLSPQEILAITFTEKAGKEMSERLYERLQYLSTHTNDKEYWNKRQDELAGAHVGTMHSLYNKIIRENPVEASISPGFSLISGINETYHINIFMKIHFEKLLKQNSCDFQNLYKQYGSLNLKRLLVHIVKSSGTLSEDKDLISNLLQDNLYVADDLAELLSKFHNTIQAVFTTENKATMQKSNKVNDLIVLSIQDIPELFSLITPEKAESYFFRQDIYDLLNGIHGSHKFGKIIKKDFQKIIETINANICAQQAAVILPGLSKLLFETLQSWRTYKLKNNLLTFDDTERLCLELFKMHPNILKKYQTKYKYVMIDEVQDLNKVQHELIQLLTNTANVHLFTVGDPKQSIYGFRGSNPGNSFTKAITISLDINFRSQASIINACNNFFSSFTATTQNNVTFSPLTPFNTSEDLNVYTTFYDKSEQNELSDLAKNILSLRNQYNIEFSDMAILVRTNTQIATISEQLKTYNIPYKASGRGGFFADIYISDLLNLLTVINNKYSHIELIGVLRSPFFGINDDTLSKLSTNDKFAWDKLNTNDIIDPSQKILLKKAYQTINELSDKSKYLPISSILDEIYYNYNWQPMVLMQSDPLQNLSNLEKMYDIAKNFEETYSPYLAEFIDYIRQLGDELLIESMPNVIDSKKSGVNIMSIHKSKGLEFKYVFMPSVEKINTKTRSNINVYSIDPENGKIGLKFLNPYTKKHMGSIEFERINNLRQAFDNHESLRILYVGMTRAKNKLFLSGTRTSKDNANAKTALEWLEKHLSSNLTQPFKNIAPLSNYKEENLNPLVISEDAFKSALLHLKALPTIEESITNITASKIHDFLTCPKFFFYRHIHNLPILNIYSLNDKTNNSYFSKAEIGTIVHEILENCTTPELVDSFCATHFDYETNKHLLNLVPIAKNLVNKYLAHPLFTKCAPNIIAKEQPFSYYHQELQINITGCIDCILQYSNGSLGIIDYKTGSNLESNLEYYKLQLALYGMVSSHIFSKTIQYTAIHYIDEKILEITMNAQEQNNYIQKVCHTIQKIIYSVQSNVFLANTDACTYCPFQYFCPENK